MIFKIILPVVLVDLTQNPARIADGYHICRADLSSLRCPTDYRVIPDLRKQFF